ncbi:putative inactive receptor kinase [Abeliophyllum distichum]|uniref:Inactive receptor kinase n=1 Tax=Abeliophyllum distichum TaxID=126358 RepID=A0ABD1SFY2_9LAMI
MQLFLFLFVVLILARPTATRSSDDGTDTNALASLPPDAVSLLSFKSKADLDNKLLYTINERFDYCQWQGVKCAQGRVVRYVVQGFGLRGTFSTATLTRLNQLRVLSLKNNSLTGPLPDFSSLTSLKTLFLDNNYFSGVFPHSLLSLHRLLILDLSHNNFTGLLPGYPDGFGPFELSPTRFQPVLWVNSSTKSIHVRSLKCDGAAAAPPPTPLMQNAQSQQGLTALSPSSQRKHHKKVGVVLGFVTGTLILIAAVLCLFALAKKRKEEREQIEAKEEDYFADATADNKGQRDRNSFSLQDESANAESEIKKMKSPEKPRIVKSGSLIFCSGEEESYTLEQLMRASAELLGRGTIGTTYKAVMGTNLVVSVKRLDACKTAITSAEAFEQQMEAIGVLRHPNLVPIRAYFQAKQERLIIFDYQPNGSLFNLIHGSRSTRAKPLHWTSCLKIAEDVAQGLAYIHQASKFVHGNLKSTNVLLGSDFEACVTDYCLAILAETSPDDDPNSAGYKAPEVRKSPRRATTKSDVYAFGILLLELLTGKPPAQHPFLAPPDMPDWVRAMREDDSEDDTRLRMLVEVASICSLTSPEQRPTMWQVLKMITNIKEIMDDTTRDSQNGYS